VGLHWLSEEIVAVAVFSLNVGPDAINYTGVLIIIFNQISTDLIVDTMTTKTIIRDLMRKKLVTTEESASVQEAASK
jgi:hypothetical protein